MLVLRGKDLVRRGAEVGRMKFVSADVASARVATQAVLYRRAVVGRYGKQVFSTAAERGRGLTAEDELVGKFCVERGILGRRAYTTNLAMGRRIANAFALVVQADDVHDGRQRHVRLGPVHRGGY